MALCPISTMARRRSQVDTSSSALGTAAQEASFEGSGLIRLPHCSPQLPVLAQPLGTGSLRCTLPWPRPHRTGNETYLEMAYEHDETKPYL